MLRLLVSMLRFRSRARMLAYAIGGLAVVTTLGARWVVPDPLPTGLVGRYYSSSEGTGKPLLERVEADLSTMTFSGHRPLEGLEAKSAEWHGFLLVRQDALYRFALKSDGGSWLWIGDRLVIDNGGFHPIRSLTGDVFLERGVHRVRLRYVQGGADPFLQLAQAGAGGTFATPAFLFQDLSYADVRIRELWPLGIVLLWYAALSALAMLALACAARLKACRDLSSALSDRTFLVVAAVGLAMSAAHMAYGLPAHDSWSPDERDPLSTLALSHTGFEDWNLRWPPMHLYVLALALRPFEWAAASFGLPLGDVAVTSAMFVVMRGVSLAMLAATLLLTFDLSRQLVDRRTGYLATMLLAFSPVVVHFGPLAHLETPHLFWMTASLWAWLKLARDRTMTAFAVFGATIGFSLATKDQAYGFYLAAPIACLLVLRQPDAPGRPHRVWAAAVGDRRLFVLVAHALLSFALGHALPWHSDRFVAHFGFMLGRQVGAFQMFDATLAGQLGLLEATARSFVWAAGVPLTVSFLAGCVFLLGSRTERRLLGHLIPLATYYVAFLCVILYVYDRFLIGALPVVAVVGGFGLRCILDARDLPRRLRMAVPLALVGAALLGALAQNVVFRDDPRRRVTDWMAQRVACGSSVGVTWTPEYVPSLDCYDVWPLTASQIETVVRWPDYFVLNDVYAARFRRTPSGRRFLQRLESGALDFERVFRAETAPPLWSPLYWEDRFRNGVEDPETTADKPLNAIEVWKKR